MEYGVKKLRGCSGQTIETAAQAPKDVRDQLLDEFDQVFFKYEERLDLKLFSYIREHKNSIRIS